MIRVPMSRALAAALSVLVGVGGIPSVLAAPADPTAGQSPRTAAVPLVKGAEMTGKILASDGTPAAGAKIVLTPLEAAGPARDAMTSRDGTYAVTSLAHGLYEVGVERNGQAFAGNRVILISPRQKHKANFRLGPFAPQDKAAGLDAGQEVAGLEPLSTGVARLDEKTGPTGLAWLRTGKGVAIFVGGAALLVAGLIALGGNKSTSVSSSSP
jgi:hypothetical protein